MRNVSIFACDPGGNSGLAWGTFPVGYGMSVYDSFKLRIDDGSDTLDGSESSQALAIAELWRQFLREKVKKNQMEPERVEFVMEDFVLRPGAHGGGKEGTSPIRIAWGVWGIRVGRSQEFEEWSPNPQTVIQPIIWQLPSEAAGYATSQRLKDWGVWVRGREHERSAWCHIAYRLSILNKQR